MGPFVDVLATTENADNAKFHQDAVATKKLTSQQELAIWQPAWPTRE